MTDYNSMYRGLYLSRDEQELLLAALSSNNPASRQNQNHDVKEHQAKAEAESTPLHASSSNFSVSPTGLYESSNNPNALSLGDDESPFLDFHPDLDFDLHGAESLFGDLPGSGDVPAGESEHGEKRKDMDGHIPEHEESGKKRRESDDKTAKKPGRKPLTSEPTTKRKAQNRAAQRAFRERKEKHLRDLENKVDELQKASDTANEENGLLKSEIERLRIEVREYRKRLSWLTSGTGLSAITAMGLPTRGAYNFNQSNSSNNNNVSISSSSSGNGHSEFLFDFPKFGDLPGGHIFNNGETPKNYPAKLMDAPGVLSRDALSGSGHHDPVAPRQTLPFNKLVASKSSDSSLRARPSHQSPSGGSAIGGYSNSRQPGTSTHESISNSPSSSSDSHRSQAPSSKGTSPEPSLRSPPSGKPQNSRKQASSTDSCSQSGAVDGEASFCEKLSMACGNINNPIPAVRNATSNTSQPSSQAPGATGDRQQLFPSDWLAQQNGGQFDPVLFGDWRESQEAILSQDFGTFFDDAFPLPDLGSPTHNITEVASQPAPKKDSNISSSIKQEVIDEEVVPAVDKTKMLTCTKIWDRLQSMEKFRNGEIDIDNLCSELRTKARCSGGGVVVDQKDVDDIMGRVR